MANESVLQRLHIFLIKTSQVWKLALSSSLSWELATLTGTKHPYFAPLAGILCLQVTIDQSIKSAINRIIGTIFGVLLTAWIAGMLGVHIWSIFLIVFIGSAVAKLVKLPQSAFYQVGISAMMVLIFEVESHTYAKDRIVETVVGALTAVAINMLFLPPNFTRSAVQSLETFTTQVVESLRQLADWTKTGCQAAGGDEIRDHVRNMFTDLNATMDQLTLAKKSLRYNFLSKRRLDALNAVSTRLRTLQLIYTQLDGIVLALAEWARTELLTQDEQGKWSGRFLTLADCVETWNEQYSVETAIGRGEAADCQQQATSTGQSPLWELGQFEYPVVIYHHVKQILQHLQPAGADGG